MMNKTTNTYNDFLVIPFVGTTVIVATILSIKSQSPYGTWAGIVSTIIMFILAAKLPQAVRQVPEWAAGIMHVAGWAGTTLGLIIIWSLAWGVANDSTMQVNYHPINITFWLGWLIAAQICGGICSWIFKN